MNVTVFLSSRDGKNPIYKDTSEKLGILLAKSGHTLVYGGSEEGYGNGLRCSHSSSR